MLVGRKFESWGLFDGFLWERLDGNLFMRVFRSV